MSKINLNFIQQTFKIITLKNFHKGDGMILKNQKIRFYHHPSAYRSKQSNVFDSYSWHLTYNFNL